MQSNAVDMEGKRYAGMYRACWNENTYIPGIFHQTNKL